MKRQSLLIAFSVLVHLMVIDITFFVVTSSIGVDNLPLITYNIVWLSVALMIGSQFYTESRG